MRFWGPFRAAPGSSRPLGAPLLFASLVTIDAPVEQIRCPEDDSHDHNHDE